MTGILILQRQVRCITLSLGFDRAVYSLLTITNPTSILCFCVLRNLAIGSKLGSTCIYEGDQFKVNMGEKKSITNIDFEMYLTLLGNI